MEDSRKKLSFKFYKKKNKKPKRVLILGSSGIVAKNLLSSLKKNKIKVQAIGKKKINLKKESSVKMLSKKILNGDVIILVAAEAPVKNIKMFINNLKICNNVCQALEKRNINHLIYISSDAVYADQKSKINEYDLTIQKMDKEISERDIVRKDDKLGDKMTVLLDALKFWKSSDESKIEVERVLSKYGF